MKTKNFIVKILLMTLSVIAAAGMTVSVAACEESEESVPMGSNSEAEISSSVVEEEESGNESSVDDSSVDPDYKLPEAYWR